MTQMELRENLSFNIKAYRKRLFLTQEKLAEKTGLSAQTINDIEGCRTWVSDKSLIKISEILHVSPSELLRSKGSISKQNNDSDNDKMMRVKEDLSSAINFQIQEIFSMYGVK